METYDELVKIVCQTARSILEFVDEASTFENHKKVRELLDAHLYTLVFEKYRLDLLICNGLISEMASATEDEKKSLESQIKYFLDTINKEKTLLLKIDEKVNKIDIQNKLNNQEEK